MKQQIKDTNPQNARSSLQGFLYRKKIYLTILSCMVVFVTTYLLILPAVTLDKDEAVKQGGIDVPAQEEQMEQEQAEQEEQTDQTEIAEPDAGEAAPEQARETEAEEPPTEQPDVLSYDGKGYAVTADTSGAGLPAETELVAEEIGKKDKDYDALYEDALQAVQKESNDQTCKFGFAKFYDISLMADGEALEPEDPINVTISYDKALKASDADKVRIVHFAVDEKTGEVTPEVLKQKHVEASVDAGQLAETTFKAESFSVFGIVYTVDFEYSVSGKKYQFSLPGGEKIALSDLVEVLGIASDTNSGEKAAFNSVDSFLKEVANVEFSDESLVKVTKNLIGDDWTLKSQGSFDTEESLTITMKNGDVITVKVTDPAAQDVSNLLIAADINATKNPDGSYTVYADQPYSIELEFKEQPNGTQFDMTNGFCYPLPAGLFDADAITGKTMIELSGGDHAGEFVELDYHLEGNNLVFTWPDQTSGAYQQLKDAIYTHFKIKINAKISENTTKLEFNDTITKNVDVKTDGKADVNKSGTYNPATNCIDYTVTVTSTGICKNVVVTDTISGTALTYNNDANATSNRGTSLPSPNANGNGFSFTIPQMGDGETVTVKYSAAVNLDALTRNDDGSLGTVSQTGNKVKVTPSNHPGDEDETSGKDLNNKISYSTISKSSSVGATGEDGHATVTWTIKANQNANVSMAGHTISDLIDANSRDIMKYSGTGITVVRKDANGNQVGSAQMISWDSLTSHSDSAWSWTVPNSNPDTGKLSYEITYTTDVDVNGKLFNTTVKNTATSDNGGSSAGSGSVGPVGGPLVARKVYLGKNMTGDEKTVSWEVNFDVPATGLDSAVIDDTLPNYWNGSSPVSDDYKDGSVTITPELAFGEGYEVSTYTDTNGRKHMTVTFHKTVNDQKVGGLSGTGTKRKIRVQFQTVLNSDWLEASKTNPNILTHTNNADVVLNGQTLGTQASVRIDAAEPEISKSHNGETVNVVNNNQLPAWQFLIILSGVSDDTFDENGQIVLYDTYNSKYLDWYPHAYTSWETQNGQVFGGNSDNKFTESSTDKVMTKVSDGQLKIVLHQSDLPKDTNGDYYPLYTIPYYLTVKDPIAWQKLIANASYTPGGSIALYNTVSNPVFGDAEDHVDYEVPVVNKNATEPTLTNGVYKLHYTVDINARALQLGDSDELVMTDDYSNISIDYTTLKIYEYINNVKTEVSDVVWDRSGYTSTFYLKNATHYVIEYDANLSGEGEKINATQSKLTYTNTAEVFGKKSTWEKTKTIESAGSGGSRTFGMKVLKHVKGNASQGLPGAVFQLWRYDPTMDDPNGKNNRPGKDAEGWVNTGKTLTTDANGYARTTNAMGIHSQTWYKLVEITPPAGYSLKTNHYFFWITEGQTADYSNYVYLNDDVMAINNTPVLPETVNVTVKKEWDDHSDLTLRRDIKVHLYADGQPYNEYYSGEYAANARTDADVTLHLNENGTSETYTWSDLPSGPAYSVVEEPVPGYTTVYSPKNTLTGGELKITNKRNTQKTAISVDKAWSNGTVPSEDVTIQLKRKISANASVVIQNGADNVGATGAYIADYSVPAGATVKLTWTWKQGWGLDTPALNIYNFGTKERIKHTDEISGNATEHSVEVTVPAEGIIVAFEKPYLNSQSAFESSFDFDIEVVSTGSGTSAEDVNFNNEHHYLTLSPDNNWHLDIDGLLISDVDGAYTYYIEEVGVNDNTQTPSEAGYAVTYSDNNRTGILNGTITVTNEKEPPAKIQVTKVLNGISTLPEGFRITNNYNDDVFTVANADKGNGTAASPYTWVIDDIPDGTEVTFTESGASVNGKVLTISANGTAQPEGSTTASASGTAAKVPTGGTIPTVSFVNDYETPQTGSLKLKKVVKVNDSEPETDAEKNLVNGDYIFTVSSGNSIIKYVQITVTDGVPASYKIADTKAALESATAETGEVALISGLAEGDYVISEVEKNGMTLKEAARGDGEDDAVSEDKAVTVHVTAGEDDPADASAASAIFTNNIETVTAKVVKVWDHTGNEGTRPGSLAVTLSNGVTRELNAGNNWTAEVTDLPKYDHVTGNPVEYIWTEAELPAGYYLSNIQESNDEATGVITTTLTNSFTDHYNPTTTITGKKVWDDGGVGRPDSITVNLYKDGGSTPYRTITVQAPTGDDSNQDEWPFEFTNLPVFNEDGSVAQYTVEEVLPEGYTDEYGIKIEFSQATYIAGDTTGTIVNSGQGDQTFKITDGYNLGYIVIRHGNDFIIWTPRPATADEISAIKAKVVGLSEQFNGIHTASGDSMKIISGVPDTVDVGKKHAVSVYMQNGEVWMKFLNPNAWSDFAYGTIPYTYTQAGGTGGGTITNTKKNTDLEFGKQWIDIGQQEIEWDQDIRLTVSRNKADGNKDSSFSLVYPVTKNAVDNATGGTVEFTANGATETTPKLKLTITTEDSKKKYKFKIENLAYFSETDGKYTYYVEETNPQLTGYLAPSYRNTSAPTGGSAAYDDGVIINQQEGGFELPSSGGPGTTWIYLLGSLLLLGCGIVLAARRRTAH